MGIRLMTATILGVREAGAARHSWVSLGYWPPRPILHQRRFSRGNVRRGTYDMGIRCRVAAPLMPGYPQIAHETLDAVPHGRIVPVSYTHLRAHETPEHL